MVVDLIECAADSNAEFMCARRANVLGVLMEISVERCDLLGFIMKNVRGVTRAVLMWHWNVCGCVCASHQQLEEGRRS